MGKVQYYNITKGGRYEPDGKPVFLPEDTPDVISLMLPVHIALLDPKAAVYVCGAVGRGITPVKGIDFLIVSDVMEKVDYGISLKAGNKMMRFLVKAPLLQFGICSPKITEDTRDYRFTYFIGRKFAGGNPETRAIFEASLKKKFGNRGPEKLLPAKKAMLEVELVALERQFEASLKKKFEQTDHTAEERAAFEKQKVKLAEATKKARPAKLELLAKFTYFLRKNGFEKFLMSLKTKELGGGEIFRIIQVAYFPENLHPEVFAKDYVKRLLADKKLSGHLKPIQMVELRHIAES